MRLAGFAESAYGVGEVGTAGGNVSLGGVAVAAHFVECRIPRRELHDDLGKPLA